jgi:hypothetical protein
MDGRKKRGGSIQQQDAGMKTPWRGHSSPQVFVCKEYEYWLQGRVKFALLNHKFNLLYSITRWEP